MSEATVIRERCLKPPEKRVRAGRFVAMSFRDLANDLGEDRASVQYDIPQMSHLGEALIDA